MGPSAKFVGPVADRDNANLRPVLLTEQRHGTHRPCFILRHQLRVNFEVFDQQLVNARLDVTQDRPRYRFRTGKVEPQPSGSILRSHLGGGLTQLLSKCSMDHVGGGMGSRNRLTAVHIHLRDNGVALRDLSLSHFPAMNEQSGYRRLNVIHLEQRSVRRGDRTVVAELPTGFGVERGPIHDEFRVLAR